MLAWKQVTALKILEFSLLLPTSKQTHNTHMHIGVHQWATDILAMKNTGSDITTSMDSSLLLLQML